MEVEWIENKNLNTVKKDDNGKWGNCFMFSHC